MKSKTEEKKKSKGSTGTGMEGEANIQFFQDQLVKATKMGLIPWDNIAKVVETIKLADIQYKDRCDQREKWILDRQEQRVIYHDVFLKDHEKDLVRLEMVKDLTKQVTDATDKDLAEVIINNLIRPLIENSSKSTLTEITSCMESVSQA